MKTQTSLNSSKVILVLAMLASIGCAKKDEGASTPQSGVNFGTPYTPDGYGPGQDPGSIFGSTAALTIAGGSVAEQMAVLADYAYAPRNNAKDVKINLNVTQTSTYTYGGTVRISYTDNGVLHEGFFTSGQGQRETQYNKWFRFNGNSIWHGVFEDLRNACNSDIYGNCLGAPGAGIAVVIDQVVDLGDGAGPEDLVNGTVWYKNFGSTARYGASYAPHPPTYCWFVSVGPYDCRPWPSGSGMNTTQSVNPTNGYRQLGRFYGLSLKKAFNTEKVYQGVLP